MLGALARNLFGTANDRIVKGFDKPVAKINALEPEIYKTILAGDLMLGRDPFGKRWNAHFRKVSAAKGGHRPATESAPQR